MTLLPELERILYEATLRDDGQRRGVLASPAPRRPSGRLARMGAPVLARRAQVVRWAAFVVVAATVGLAAALATHDQPATGSRYDHAPEVRLAGNGTHASRAGAQPSAAVTANFSILATPQSATDTLGDRDQGGVAAHFYADQTHLGAKLDPLRGPARAVPDDIYIAGGVGDTICLLALPQRAAGPTGQCVAPNVATAGRSVMTMEHDSEIEIFGLVPDGVNEVGITLASGAAVSLPVRNNIYSALLPGAPATVGFDAAGQHIRVNAP